MSRFNCVVAFVTAALLAGCAVSLEEAAESAPDAATATGASVQSGAAAPAPDLVVNVEDLAAGDTGVICRQMLRESSNVIVNRCMTPSQWKTFNRLTAMRAQEALRRMQSGRYR